MASPQYCCLNELACAWERRHPGGICRSCCFVDAGKMPALPGAAISAAFRTFRDSLRQRYWGDAVHRQGDAWRLPYTTVARYFGIDVLVVNRCTSCTGSWLY